MTLMYRLDHWGKQMKVGRATAKNTIREVLEGAWLTSIKPRRRTAAAEGKMQPVLYASDSFIAVRLPWGYAVAEKDLPPEGWIPPEAVKALDTLKKSDSIKIEKDAVRLGRVRFSRELPKTGLDQKEAQFADIEALIPKSNPKMERRFYVGFNATFLKNLSAAMGSEGLEVEFNLDDIVRVEGGKPQYLKPLVVRPLDGLIGPDDMRLGLQMPIRLQQTKGENDE